MGGALFLLLLVFGLSQSNRSSPASGPPARLPPGPAGPPPLAHDADPLATLAAGGGNAGTIPLGTHDDLVSAEQVSEPSSQSDAQEAAHGLALFLGTGGRNRETIRGYQRRMGHLRVDGIVGPETQARMRALGER